MRKPDRIDFILFILFICVFFIHDLFSTLETQKMKTKELIELLKSMPDQGATVEVLIDGKYYRFVGAFDIPATACENGRLVLMGASDQYHVE